MTELFSELARQERARIVSREAAHALHEDGCFRLRVEDVARRSGVAKGTVYLDFGSKASLLSGALDDAREQLMEAIESRIADTSTADERLYGALFALAENVAGPVEMRVLIEGRLPCAVRWIGGDPAPAEQIERRLADLISAAVPGVAHEPDAAAQAVLAVASTSASQRLAAERGPAVLADWLKRVARTPAGP